MNNNLPPFGESMKWLLSVPSIVAGALSATASMIVWRFEWGDPGDILLIGFPILWIPLFGLLLFVFYNRVVNTKVENWTGIDLNRNGAVGNRVFDNDVPMTNYGNVPVPQNWAGFPVTEKQMLEVAYGMLADRKTLSERNFAGGGRPLSVEQFRRLQPKLVERGWFEWKSDKDNRQGADITPEGERMLWKLLDKHGLIAHSTPLLEEEVSKDL